MPASVFLSLADGEVVPVPVEGEVVPGPAAGRYPFIPGLPSKVESGVLRLCALANADATTTAARKAGIKMLNILTEASVVLSGTEHPVRGLHRRLVEILVFFLRC